MSKDKLKVRILRHFRKNPSKSYNAVEIVKALRLKRQKTQVIDALRGLKIANDIKHIGKGRFVYAEKPTQIITGTVDATKTGSAYIITDAFEEDVFVPKSNVGTAMNGDIVEVSVRKGKNRIKGKITKVLERKTERMVGHIDITGDYGFVRPENGHTSTDIYVDKKDFLGANDDDLVVVQITKWPSREGKSPEGKVIEILAKDNVHDSTIKTILINSGFGLDFPEAVKQECRSLQKEISKKEISKRRDFRDTTTFTIDPYNAKDFDDALSVKFLDNDRVEVGVHIADVTHYVKEGTAIDKEAYKRSTSVYLVDRVIPMLPEVLSNELCSLRPEEESLTFSAVFTFNKSLDIVDKWFGKTIIYSDHRFTYEEAQEIILGKEDPLKNEIQLLDKIAKKLRKKRFDDGAVDFDSPEVKIYLDEDNNIKDIQTKERFDAHLLVEEYMLLANISVAEHLYNLEKPEIPSIYRVHDGPDPERTANFVSYLKQLDIDFKWNNPEEIRNSINKLAQDAKESSLHKLLLPMAIRIMSKAIYTTDNIGHFGLSEDTYTHFTSPIRRYADVLVHRNLFRNLNDKRFRYKKAELEAQGVHISAQERKAMEAERESVKYKQVEFLSQHIDENFDGIISGIIDRGLFVILQDNYCEGLLPFDEMDEPFVVASDRYSAEGQHSGTVYKMGDPIKVRVVSANIAKRTVDFELG